MKAGCTKAFDETVSGANAKRTQLRKALAKLEEGDVLMVTRLDLSEHIRSESDPQAGQNAMTRRLGSDDCILPP